MSGAGEPLLVNESLDDTNEEAARPEGLPLVFKGNAREYFRLWIVNLCLTLLTFGIFSAWAKVRRKRYFYSHTELAGVPFEYLGAPLPILKGRLVAAALVGLWYVGTHGAPRLLFAVLGVGIVLAPWVMVRSAAFNARYSAYRNIAFDFSGSYRTAASALILSLLLCILTCGFGYPWAVAHLRRYFIERTSYGGVLGAYTARGKHLAKPFWLLTGMAAVFIGGMGGAGALAERGTEVGPWVTAAVVAGYAAYGLGYAFWQARVARINWKHTWLGPLRFSADYRARDFIGLYLTNALAIVGSLGLLVPWAAVRTYRYRIERLTVEQDGRLGVFEGYPRSATRAAGAEVMDLFDFDLSL
jgi:uncharacterized membrane protein YjgN (DUF898 family)